MISIDMALDFVLENRLFGEKWILSDSRSVVQYLDNWRYVSDRRRMNILNKLKTPCNSSFAMDTITCKPPTHSWYRSEGSGSSIHFKGDRKGQAALARLTVGHLKTLRFSRGDKKFNICTKCNMIEATPQHLLDCVDLVYDDLLKRPDFVLEVITLHYTTCIPVFRALDPFRFRWMEVNLFFKKGQNLVTGTKTNKNEKEIYTVQNSIENHTK
ncbi:hypothetical protein AVEN_209864-1 [Araneus ventricosus]|uniref:Uncharacterized protein n=1 Tax=Araneus ventricosus TaxID=182803 RepID=A0A4Y2ISJ4_ARAVE|nr:hypothetical protein AVEN_209864-1 [Araneus ventricosus]